MKLIDNSLQLTVGCLGSIRNSVCGSVTKRVWTSWITSSLGNLYCSLWPSVHTDSCLLRMFFSPHGTGKRRMFLFIYQLYVSTRKKENTVRHDSARLRYTRSRGLLRVAVHLLTFPLDRYFLNRQWSRQPRASMTTIAMNKRRTNIEPDCSVSCKEKNLYVDDEIVFPLRL